MTPTGALRFAADVWRLELRSPVSAALLFVSLNPNYFVRSFYNFCALCVCLRYHENHMLTFGVALLPFQ